MQSSCLESLDCLRTVICFPFSITSFCRLPIFLWLFLFCNFIATGPFASLFFQKAFQHFSLRDRLFLSGQEMVVDDTNGSCHITLVFAVTYIYLQQLYLVSVNQMERSTVPACPSLLYFFNTGNVEGTNSSQCVFDICVYMFCCVFVQRLILWI